MIAVKGFGRSHAYFRSGVGEQNSFRLPAERAAGHVADRHYRRAPLLRGARRRQSVEGFPRLTQSDDQAPFVEHRFAIVELRTVIHLRRYPHQLLHVVLPD